MEWQNRRWTRDDLVALLGAPNNSGTQVAYPPLASGELMTRSKTLVWDCTKSARAAGDTLGEGCGSWCTASNTFAYDESDFDDTNWQLTACVRHAAELSA
jgi:hypothetical protein